MKRVAVFGDSFSNGEDGWPGYVTRHYKSPYMNYSLAASSMEFTFFNLESFLKADHADIILITITASDRYYHPQFLIRSSDCMTLDHRPASNYIQRAAKEYYSSLWTIRNSEIKEIIMLHAFSSLTAHYPNTKFVFLPCFQHYEQNSVGNYVLMGPRLMNFSQMADEYEKEMREKGEYVGRNNHLTKNQNDDLTEQIIDAVENHYVHNSPNTYQIDLSRC